MHKTEGSLTRSWAQRQRPHGNTQVADISQSRKYFPFSVPVILTRNKNSEPYFVA